MAEATRHGYRQITSRLRVRLRHPDISPCDDATYRGVPPQKVNRAYATWGGGGKGTVHARREEWEMDRVADDSMQRAWASQENEPY